MSEIKVSKISSLSAAQTLQVGGKGMMIGGTAENTTLIISTTSGGIPTIPHGDMSLFITDGTIQSTYGYQTTTGSIVGEFLGTYSNHPVGIMTSNATRLFISATGNVGIGTTTPDAVLDVPGVKANSNGVMNHYTDLAQLATTNSVAGTLNGALQIVLPYNFSSGRNTVMTVKIMGNSYRSPPATGNVGGHSWEVTLTAYFTTANSSQWWTSTVVPTVEIRGHAPFSKVRLGARLATVTADAGKAVILLGDDTTLWNTAGDLGYTVAVTDLWTSFQSLAGWGQGWKINNTPILDSNFSSQFETVASGKMFTCRVDQYMDMNGNVGIGTTSPQGKLEVWNGATYLNNGRIDGNYGDQIFFGAAPSGYGTTYLHKIKTSHSSVLANSLMTFSLDNGQSTFADVLTLAGSGLVSVQKEFALAPIELYTTERKFTQTINTSGSNANGQAIAGQTWLLGTFSDVNSTPAMFKFVHNTHTGNNLQSDSYEWSRTYLVDLPASATVYSDWVELPVTTSVVYSGARQFRFDIRAKFTGDMQLRMRASTTSAYDGSHWFTFTTTGNTTYTPETNFGVATAPTTLPTGFHGRQAYEFPVSKGNYGFAGSTAGVFILNSGNVGVGTVTPAVELDVMGSIRATDNLTIASRAQILSSPHLLQTKSTIVGAGYTNGNFNGLFGLYGTEGLGIGSGAGIMFGGGFTAGDPNLLTAWAEVSGVRENATSGLYDGALVFKTRSTNIGNVAEAMRITSTGKVGIRTAAPQDTLTVTPPFSEAPQGIGFYSAENLLRNGNWPNTTVAGQAAEGWTVYSYNGADPNTINGSAVWVTVATGPRGASATALQCQNGGGAHQTVSLTPGAVYTVSARIRVSSVNNTGDGSAARFSIGVSGNFTGISDAVVYVDMHDSGNSLNKWCYCSQTFTVPASASLLNTIYVGVRSMGTTHSIQVTDMALYKGGIAKVFSPISVQEDTQKVLINGIPAAYSEPDVLAAPASATSGFRFGAIGATGLTNYSGYTVKYTKTGSLIQVEGLITNTTANTLAFPSGTVVLKGLPTPKANNAVTAIGMQQWTTLVPMYVYVDGSGGYGLHMMAPAGITLGVGNGTTVGGYIAVNFSYMTT